MWYVNKSVKQCSAISKYIFNTYEKAQRFKTLSPALELDLKLYLTLNLFYLNISVEKWNFGLKTSVSLNFYSKNFAKLVQSRGKPKNFFFKLENN
jgi:hypothetical protein